jgi:CRISPR-associated protein Cas5t
MCCGAFNSYRQPDFHTYHKTLSLPPKTTVAGLIGSALGISPSEVNKEWLLKDRFRMGIVGTNNGQANDLWQIRKYESKQMKAYHEGKEASPYKTAVIVRELLFQSEITLYLTFESESDFDLVKSALLSPEWALSLGREDELIRIDSIVDIDFPRINNQHIYKNTVIAGDLAEFIYRPLLKNNLSGNLLKAAPKTVTLPVSFINPKDSEVRQGNDFRKFTYVGNLPILMKGEAFWDESLENSFQIF